VVLIVKVPAAGCGVDVGPLIAAAPHPTASVDTELPVLVKVKHSRSPGILGTPVGRVQL
jgi:hypothetical protein